MPEPQGFYSRGYLPHYDATGLVQMVTFRLHDSLPKAVLEKLQALARGYPEGEQSARLHRLIDDYLDSGKGACWLANGEVAGMLTAELKHFDGVRYRLIAWVIMPNHVHVIVQPMPGFSLMEIIRSWKARSAVRANRILGRQGAFWQREYFDRYMRDEDHLEKAAAYIHYNPVKAGLVAGMEEWEWSSYLMIHTDKRRRMPG